MGERLNGIQEVRGSIPLISTTTKGFRFGDLAAYSRMQLQKSKVSMSFSALLFGPFYFFYRKAWRPAFGFLAAELLLAAPTFIEMLQLSGSALAPAMPDERL